MKTAFVFSGQGSQYPGMFKDIYEQNDEARRVFETASESLGRDIASLCFSATDEELNLTHNTQPCVLTADLAAAAAIMSYGIKPDAVAGFSLGEYAAMTVSGILSSSDVFPLIQLRADAMQKAVPVGEGGMAAVIGRSASDVEELCKQVKDDYVTPANYNSPSQTVVAGTASGIEKFLALASENGVTAIKLKVSAPFHCALMKSAADELKTALDKRVFGSSELPIYLNYTGNRLKETEKASDMLYMQAFNPVLWTETINNMVSDGVTHFVECGPGRTLSGLIKSTAKNVKILRVENVSTLEKTLTELKG